MPLKIYIFNMKHRSARYTMYERITTDTVTVKRISIKIKRLKHRFVTVESLESFSLDE